MIDATDNLTSLSTSLQQLPQRSVQPAQATPQALQQDRGRRQIPPEEREAAEQLLRDRQQGSQTSPYAEDVLGRRAQRALSAYAGQQDATQREYVSQVLGIDERV